jgi:hypothetical protein
VLAAGVLALGAFSVGGCLLDSASETISSDEGRVEASSDDEIRCVEHGQPCRNSQDCCGNMLCKFWKKTCYYDD